MDFNQWRSDFQSEARVFIKKSSQDLILTQATALAYNSLVSLVPILAVAFFLFHTFGGFAALQDKLQPFIEQNLAPAFSDRISQYLDGFIQNVHAGAVGIIGVIGFVFTAISTLATIERTFNLIWGATKQRSIRARITAYWSLLTLGPLLLGVSLGLSSKALGWASQDSGFLSPALALSMQVFPYLAMALLLTGIYMFMPNVTVHFRDAVKAGSITAVVFEIAKWVYALYVKHSFQHSGVYGSLVVIPLFLLWLYVVWLIVLLGAELCCYFQYHRLKIPYRADREEYLNPFIILDLVEFLHDRQKKANNGSSVPAILHELRIPLKDLMVHLQFLETVGWINWSESSFLGGAHYFLSVNSEDLTPPKILSILSSHHYKPHSEKGRALQAKVAAYFSPPAASNSPR